MSSLFYANISHIARNVYGIFYDSNRKNTIKRMHLDGWKNYFIKSAYVSIMYHGCGVSQFTQFYDKSLYIYNVNLSIHGN